MRKEDRAAKPQIKISVRNFVEFLLRSGDIDNRRHQKTEGAMQEGAKIHRIIQRRMGSEYQAEVFLRYGEETEKYQLSIEGRADGIITLKELDKSVEEEKKEVFSFGQQRIENQVIVDEIKGTYKNLDRIEEPEPVHLAQVRVYAYIYARKTRQTEIGIRMTYCHLETEEIKYFFYDYTIKELEEWFQAVLKEYKKWADFQVDWKEIRQVSLKKVSFPFDYRQGQKQLVTGVYSTIYHKKKLFLQAPTGVGKTISTIFPAVKALGEQLGERIFYFTAKTITRIVAEETFDLLRKQGMKFKTVTLTAKEKICFREEVKCNPLECSYAKGHFDRINEALYQMIIQQDTFSKEIIEKYAQEYHVCPFELALDASLFSDGIIGDYNYLFDPHVHLKRFFGENVNSAGVFLIDEAHNLVERGREMYSASLIKEEFLALKSRIRPYSEKMEKQLSRCNQELLVRKKETEKVKKWVRIDSLVLSLNRLYQTMNEYLENNNDGNVIEEVLELFFKIKHFLMIYDSINDKYVIYSQIEENGEFKIKLFCMEPSEALKQCMDKGISSILFSATFLPIQYYKKLLGGTKEDYEIYARTPFEAKNRCLCIARDVTTRYSSRGEKEYYKFAEYIHLIVTKKKGNYMIFFPSYTVMQQIGKIYEDYFKKMGSIECVYQKEFMKEEEREHFLKLFTRDFSLKIEDGISRGIQGDAESLLGFCVMGGIFSEGIDLKRDSLIGVIVVGTGLPQICPERELLKEYYERLLKKGFDYAYRYPGMNKVLQASGRVIRTSEDRGVIVLLDQRFLEHSYRELFPREWQDIGVISRENVEKAIENFWKPW